MSRKYFENGNLDLIAGRHVTDKQLDSTSNHAIANRIVTAEFGKVEDRLDLNNCRNVLYPTAKTVTKSGVTMVCNNDGSITLSGSNTHNTSIYFMPFPYINNYMFLKNGNYKIGGSVIGGRIQKVSGQLYETIACFQLSKTTNEGGMTELIADSDVEGWADVEINGGEAIEIYLVVNQGANFGSGMKIYPMLIADSVDGVTTYEQGELSNRELSVTARDMISDMSLKQPKTLSQSIAGQTTVEGALSTISTNLLAKAPLKFTTYTGNNFAGLVGNGEVWLIAVCRLTTNESFVGIANRVDSTMTMSVLHTTNAFNYDVNAMGTVVITWGGTSDNVEGAAIRLR